MLSNPFPENMLPVAKFWKLYLSIGYGVETSHLLDLYHKFGLEAFAQTDLDRRVHRNQTTTALGKMSFESSKPLSTVSMLRER